MGIAFLVVAVVVAGLACPAMMLWQRRRGRAATCCLPSGDDGGGEREVEELRRDQATLSARLDALQGNRAELQVTGQGKDG